MDVTKLRSTETVKTQQKDLRESGSIAKSKVSVETAEKSSSQAQGPSRSDFVKWSPEAELFAEGLEAAKSAPDVRSEKVKAFKEAIARGEYQVNPEAIADKMLRESFEMASLHPKKK